MEVAVVLSLIQQTYSGFPFNQQQVSTYVLTLRTRVVAYVVYEDLLEVVSRLDNNNKKKMSRKVIKNVCVANNLVDAEEEDAAILSAASAVYYFPTETNESVVVSRLHCTSTINHEKFVFSRISIPL